MLVTVISLHDRAESRRTPTMLMAPRVLLAIGRDGFFTPKAAAVSAGGTPRLALAVSSAAAAALILTGTFEQIIALATVLFLLIYIADLRRGVRAAAARARHAAALSRVRFSLHHGDRMPRVRAGAARCRHRGPALGLGGWRAVARPARPSMPGSPGAGAGSTRARHPQRLSGGAAGRDPEGSVEVGRQLGILRVLEHALDLRRGRASDGQGRQRVAREE